MNDHDLDSAIMSIIATLGEGASNLEAAKAVLTHLVVWAQGDDLSFAGANILLRDPRFSAAEVAAEVPGSANSVATASVSLDSGGDVVGGARRAGSQNLPR